MIFRFSFSQFSFLYLFLVLIFCSGCPQTEKNNVSITKDQKDKTFGVLTTVEPIAWLVDRIGGGRFHTEVLVQSGKEPETFAPSPQKIVSLTQNKIFFRVGLTSEQTLLPKLKTNAPQMKIIDLREGLVLLPLHDHSSQKNLSDKSHDHEKSVASENSHDHNTPHEIDPSKNKSDKNHESDNDHDQNVAKPQNDHEEHSNHAEHDCGEDGLDPHFWMSPQLTKKIVQTMADALEKEDPAGGPTYRKNADLLLKEISGLQTAIRARLAPVKGKTILVFHPAYGYFCREFGLVQLAVEEGGKSPRPKTISNLIAKTQKDNIQLLIVQPEFNRESAASMAEAAGLKTALHSPLIADYFKNLNELTDLIVPPTGSDRQSSLKK